MSPLSIRTLALLLTIITLPAFAEANRIVSLGAQVTETLFALGVGDRVVAIDSSSLWPPQARTLPKVGYFRTLGAEGLLSVEPDLVIGNTDAGPPEALNRLRKAGIAVRLFDGKPRVESALSLISDVARTVDRADAGEIMIAQIRSQLTALESKLADQPRPRVLSLMAAQGAMPLAAGRDTNAGLMIELAGGQNIGQDFEGYKPLSAESLVQLAPEVIVVPQHVLPQLGGLEGLRRNPAIAATPAGRDSRIVVMDSVLLLGLGPRLGAAATQLARAIHQTPLHGG